MRRARTFTEETRGLDYNSPEYKAIRERYQKAEEQDNRKRAYTHKLVKGILNLTLPAKHLNVSKLSQLSNEELTRIGKAARELYNELRKAGVNF